MTFETITVERDGALLWLTLNRPNEANALSIPLADEFCAAIDQAEADAGCHVLVLQGAGKFFCAGGDVAGMAGSADPADFLRTLAGTMHAGLLSLARSRLVTIAAVHGPAAGAGLGLVLNADFVLATPKASFLSAYAGIGLTPDCGVSYLLPQIVGPRRAAEIGLGGRVATAQEALDWGLVTELVEEADLRNRARQLGERLAGGATQALGPTKRLLTSARLSAYAEHLADEVETISRLVSLPDSKERVAAFVERRRS
ncbi:enoyl-CoA hydratase/isomerase family protein [Specibacter cremeus]|uniref:enoyl-CoA hydratase/isomerase family protein n=1 Tax=Specibacter cremeus TaxID=1629051 RepID=UPI000F76A4FD|nr:enoyl-CoA hydratase/isomerase family protein [Specibacter cremeus]